MFGLGRTDVYKKSALYRNKSINLSYGQIEKPTSLVLEFPLKNRLSLLPCRIFREFSFPSDLESDRKLSRLGAFNLGARSQALKAARR